VGKNYPTLYKVLPPSAICRANFDFCLCFNFSAPQLHVIMLPLEEVPLVASRSLSPCVLNVVAPHLSSRVVDMADPSIFSGSSYNPLVSNFLIGEIIADITEQTV
jgi:hypothetical protein